MVWSQFSIKMIGVHFHNSAHDKRNWDKIYDNLTKQNSYLKQNAALFERKKITKNQIFWSKLWYIGHIYTIPKCIWKKTEKRIISSEATKNKTSQAPSSAPHIWKGGLGILDIDIQQNSVNIKWIQRLLNPTNMLQKPGH